jgi:hypothetical protein
VLVLSAGGCKVFNEATNMTKHIITRPQTAKVTLDCTAEAYMKIVRLDESFIGTYNYMGHAFFWATEYKHELRGLSINERRAVHHMWMEIGLDVEDVSELHAETLHDFLNR